MTEAVKTEVAVDETVVDGDQQGASEETVESLKVELAKANAEAAKSRKIAKEAIAKRDAVKKTGSEDGQDYKKLFADSEAKTSKLVDRMKRADITAAATAQLTKIGITPDALPLALKSLDMNAIEWDEEEGVDGTSVRAAVTTLRNEFSFLFEKKVTSTSVKVAKDGSTGGADKTISRSDFDKLSGMEKNARIAAKYVVVD